MDTSPINIAVAQYFSYPGARYVVYDADTDTCYERYVVADTGRYWHDPWNRIAIAKSMWTGSAIAITREVPFTTGSIVMTGGIGGEHRELLHPVIEAWGRNYRAAMGTVHNTMYNPTIHAPYDWHFLSSEDKLLRKLMETPGYMQQRRLYKLRNKDYSHALVLYILAKILGFPVDIGAWKLEFDSVHLVKTLSTPRELLYHVHVNWYAYCRSIEAEKHKGHVLKLGYPLPYEKMEHITEEEGRAKIAVWQEFEPYMHTLSLEDIGHMVFKIAAHLSMVEPHRWYETPPRHTNRSYIGELFYVTYVYEHGSACVESMDKDSCFFGKQIIIDAREHKEYTMGWVRYDEVRHLKPERVLRRDMVLFAGHI